MAVYTQYRQSCFSDFPEIFLQFSPELRRFKIYLMQAHSQRTEGVAVTVNFSKKFMTLVGERDLPAIFLLLSSQRLIPVEEIMILIK